MSFLKKIFFFLIFFTFGFSYGQNAKTFTYKSLNDTTLELDFYSSKSHKKSPTVVFVHGGSFMTGSKNSSYVTPYAKKWTEAGYNFVAINYRLTLKGKTFHCNCPSDEKVKTFENAVYDLRAAINYLIENSKTLKINTKKIILAGNSAGAETILHAAFWKNNEHNVSKQILSDKFKYAAVLAYAGAIVDTNLITKHNKIPTALFHGSCDQFVPYKTATHHFCADSTVGALMLSGSFDIMKRLQNLDESYYLYTFCNGLHDVNTMALNLEVDNAIEFINNTVIKKKKSQSHKVEKSSLENCKFVEVDFCK